MYKQQSIVQIGTCKVQIKHKNNQLPYKFFVVPGDRVVLLEIPSADY